MKKILICFILLALLLTGCSNNNTPQQNPDDFAVAKPAENFEKNNSKTDSTDKTVEFGKNNIGDTIQVNQKKINWATYDDMPIDVLLEYQEVFADVGTSMMIPAWGRYNYSDSLLLNNGPDYIIITARTDKTEILEDSIRNTVEWKDLIHFQAETTETTEINGYETKINIGSCVVNNNAQNKKQFVSLVMTNEGEAYCLLAITQDDAVHTTAFYNTMLREMAKTLVTIYQEDDGPVEQETEANE